MKRRRFGRYLHSLASQSHGPFVCYEHKHSNVFLKLSWLEICNEEYDQLEFKGVFFSDSIPNPHRIFATQDGYTLYEEKVIQSPRLTYYIVCWGSITKEVCRMLLETTVLPSCLVTLITSYSAPLDAFVDTRAETLENRSWIISRPSPTRYMEIATNQTRLTDLVEFLQRTDKLWSLLSLLFNELGINEARGYSQDEITKLVRHILRILGDDERYIDWFHKNCPLTMF
jgi:hypothetical protein